MTGSERRDAIIKQIRESRTPVSGKSLAAAYDVSRQVIVQDIALIRAAGHDIMSTNRGYIINEPVTVSRVFKVKHTDEQVEEELTSIVDLGGCVRNVMVNHRVYGVWSGTEYQFQAEGGGFYQGSEKRKVQSAEKILLQDIIITLWRRTAKRRWA